MSEVTNWSSNGFLQSAIDSSADCVMALDREGALVLMNKAALGVVTAEGSARIVGQHWSLFWPRAVHDHLRQGLAIAGHGGWALALPRLASNRLPLAGSNARHPCPDGAS